MKRYFITIVGLILIGLFFTSVSYAVGYDIVLVIDDSGSMKKSDENGRRVGVINQLRHQFYSFVYQGSKLQQPMDFRLSVIRFGDRARLFRDWTEFRQGVAAPMNEEYAIDNMGWTDFDQVMALAQNQFEKITFGRDRPGGRHLILMVVTDGVPSTKDDPYKGVPGKGKDPNSFWKRMQSTMDYISNNANTVADPSSLTGSHAFSSYMLVMHDPNTEEGADLASVLPKWENIGFSAANIFKLSSRQDNTIMYQTLDQIVESLLHGSGSPTYVSPDQNGNFSVPCFQEKIFFQVYLYPEQGSTFGSIRLSSPSNATFGDEKSAPFWVKTGQTLLNADIEAPEPGVWKIHDYNPGETQFSLRFLPVSYQINQIYPPKDNLLLRVPEQFQFSIDLQNSSASAQQNTCELSGEIQIDTNGDEQGDSRFLLEATYDGAGSKIEVHSVQKYQPPGGLNFVSMKILLEAEIAGEKSSVLETDWKTLAISDKQPVAMKVQGTSGEIIGNEGTIHLRLGLVDYFDNNKQIRVTDVFKKPDQSITASISCADCEASTKQTIPLQRLDDLTMGADVTIKRQGGWPSNYWRLLTGQDLAVNVTWQATNEMELRDNILLLGLQSGGRP